MFKQFATKTSIKNLNTLKYVTDSKNTKEVGSRINRALKKEEMRKQKNLETKKLKTFSKINTKVDKFHISQPLSLSIFANQLGVTTGQLLRKFSKQLGNVNTVDLLSIKLMKKICQDLYVITTTDEEELIDVYPTLEPPEDEETFPRPAVVTIMGHVVSFCEK
jgi:hypothetical protein